MIIQDKTTCLVWRMTLAIAAGILLGGVAARVENRVCAGSETPPGYCLTETSHVRVANGMVGGACASGGALLMIELWSRLQRDDG
jgi:hypothetical protein